MASTALLGFIKGASGEALDALHRREQADEELRKQKLLEQLRLETEKDMAVFRDNLTKNDVDHDLSSADYESGKYIMRNKAGEVVSQRDLTPSEIQQHKMVLDKAQSDIDNTKSEIGYRQSQIGLDSAKLGIEARNSNIEAMNAQTQRSRLALDQDKLDADKKTAGMVTDDGRKVLLGEYNKTMDELTKAGALPRVLAGFQTAWYEGVNQGGWNTAQQREFLKRTRQHWTTGVTLPDGTQTKPLLDKYSLGPLDQAMMQNSANGGG